VLGFSPKCVEAQGITVECAFFLTCRLCAGFRVDDTCIGMSRNLSSSTSHETIREHIGAYYIYIADQVF